jgi:hypothetical protein
MLSIFMTDYTHALFEYRHGWVDNTEIAGCFEHRNELSESL